MIGCIGYGYVGSALSLCFSKKEDVIVYDIIDVSEKLGKNMIYYNELSKCVNHIEKNMDKPIYFICVPTPMRFDTFKCDTKIIDSVTELLYNHIKKRSFVIIKSTIPIGKCDIYKEKFGDKMDIIFNPEFLTQKNAVDDFNSQERTIIGSYLEECELADIKSLYLRNLKNIKIEYCLPMEAELSKLMLNSFWATKVAFANQFYDISNSMGINYNNIVKLIKGDNRIGKTHLDVPGHDNLRGFGGVCLPKDLNNIRTFSKERGINTTLLDAVWELNCDIREDKDWEKLINKAVTKE